MDAINQLILLPASEHLSIIPYLIVFMLLLCLPFAGTALVSCLLSLGFPRRGSDAAREFARLIPVQAGTFLTFALLPLVALVFLYSQYLYHQAIPAGIYFLRISPFLLAGLLLLGHYQRTLRPAAGAAGVVITAGACFLTISTLDLAATPQKWSFITSPVPLVFSVTVVVHFLIFLAASALLAGAAGLFLLFRWPERRLPEDFPARGMVRGWALSLLTGSALALPLLMLWDLYTLPDFTLTARTFVISFLLLFLLLLLAGWGLSMLRHGCHRFATASFVAALLVFGLFVYKHQQLQSSANRETLIVLAQASEKAMDEWREKREALYAKAATVDVKLGQKIYDERCSACHRFDQKLVGPPYYEVLPKYKDAPEKLQAFIRNPVKIDPAYPPMPNQGLREAEVKSVAAFLLEKLAEKK